MQWGGEREGWLSGGVRWVGVELNSERGERIRCMLVSLIALSVCRLLLVHASTSFHRSSFVFVEIVVTMYLLASEVDLGQILFAFE